jgi:hypothetical protein
MSYLCSDQDLISLSSAILACIPSKSLTNNQKPIVLAIRKLKRFMTSDTQKIITVKLNYALLIFFSKINQGVFLQLVELQYNQGTKYKQRFVKFFLKKK